MKNHFTRVCKRLDNVPFDEKTFVLLPREQSVTVSVDGSTSRPGDKERDDTDVGEEAEAEAEDELMAKKRSLRLGLGIGIGNGRTSSMSLTKSRRKRCSTSHGNGHVIRRSNASDTCSLNIHGNGRTKLRDRLIVNRPRKK